MRALAGVAAFTLAAHARAAEDMPRDHGFELDVRTGYAVPVGSLDGKSPLNAFWAGALPIGLGAGYRIHPRIYVGGYFQYAYGIMSGRICQELDCSANDYRFGVDARFYVSQGQSTQIWIGLGAGAEFAHIRANGPSGRATFDLGGPEYAHLQVGGDYRLSSHVGIGPFVGMSLARFGGGNSSTDGHIDIEDAALHGWLSLGLRGVFNP
ncbi:hypothetical protein LZC95_23585 [Pendulispora brunnea]|uniref:Outer membrane protein beta-barrel domain-containing protein n=1 Tax=Pendulispora brunnea TaxID=2905690 RepID=A0ABZ2KNZ7_9BACT